MMEDWPGLGDAMAISHARDIANSSKRELQEVKQIILAMRKELETLKNTVETLVQSRR